MKTTFKLEGLADFDAALAELPKATARNVLQRVLLKAGEPMRAEAQELAPERPADAPVEKIRRADGSFHIRQIGTSKALVQISTKLTPRQARETKNEGKSFAEVYVGTRDRLSPLEEFGTSHTAPHPFMRPAWEHNKEGALETVRTELGAEIQKAAERLAKKAAKAAGG